MRELAGHEGERAAWSNSEESPVTKDEMDSIGTLPAGTLFVVATPIGNLGDLSPRAAAVLRGAGVVLAEDTRHTQKLLNASGIARLPGSLESLHEHNERERVAGLVDRLRDGASMALVSDAGTPLMSDPGAVLVREAALAGVNVVAVPGACAAVAALSITGLPADRFAFEGFLPAKATARRRVIESLVAETRSLVFYEAPHRLAECLADLAAGLEAGRDAAVAREISKKFETVYRGTLTALAARAATDADMTRGEIVIVVRGAVAQDDAAVELAAADKVLGVLLEELPVSQAAKLAARITGRGRSELYERALERAKAARE
jgi:16S rRNA (cytidine1402-2'-O)-methyltransferase